MPALPWSKPKGLPPFRRHPHPSPPMDVGGQLCQFTNIH